VHEHTTGDDVICDISATGISDVSILNRLKIGSFLL